ncbi:sigma-70 family RNA polymerase sigma factor [candidate division WOR-3 bacterium]|nr:sigma-70 family RNA polymerase sigma factor [candidate division WOR-3 bacterium]
MNELDMMALMQKFEAVSRLVCKKFGMPGEWEEFYIEMCCAFVRKSASWDGKPPCYIVKACKNEAINEYFKGKSVCSKPRKNATVISIEEMPDLSCGEVDFVKHVHDKILVEKIIKILTARERQIAEMLMDGYSEHEIAECLKISQSRVNYLKQRMKKKTKKLLSRGL